MTDVDEFLDEFLSHDRDAARVREYNRQYYLRKRKLKGRQTGDNKEPVSTLPYGAKRKMEGRGPGRTPSGQQGAAERRQIAAEKLKRAREAVKKLPPDQRNAVEKKLDAAEKKLKSVNPFSKKKKSAKPKWSTAAEVKKKNAARKKDLKKRADAVKKAAEGKNPDTLRKVWNVQRKVNRALNDPRKLKKDATNKAKSAAKRATQNPFEGAKLTGKKPKGPENPFGGMRVKVKRPKLPNGRWG